jgi:hypothetical protein
MSDPVALGWAQISRRVVGGTSEIHLGSRPRELLFSATPDVNYNQEKVAVDCSP